MRAGHAQNEIRPQQANDSGKNQNPCGLFCAFSEREKEKGLQPPPPSAFLLWPDTHVCVTMQAVHRGSCGLADVASPKRERDEHSIACQEVGFFL